MKKYAFALFLALLPALFVFPSSAYAAIAFDNSTTNHTTASASATFALTVGAGSDRVLFVGFTANKSSIPAISSVTYAGVSMTASAFSPQALPSDTTVQVYLYYLLNPTSGSNNVVITFGSSLDEINSNAVAYSGVGGVEEAAHINGTGTSATVTTVTTADLSWIVGVFRNNNNGDGSAGAGTTKRSFVSGQNGFYDSGGPLSPTGSYSIISTFGSAQYGALGMTMTPAVPSAATPIMSLVQAFFIF